MEQLVLFHGSQQAVPRPSIEKCRPNNDYGRGFYCTADEKLACEWACQKGTDGFVNRYELPLEGLKVLDLNREPFTLLHWLEVLFTNRLVRLSTPTMQRGAHWLEERFPVDISDADVVHGYRADNSYFGFARAFLRNEITLSELGQAMHLGNLGSQYMVKSAAAFKALRYLGCEPADASIWWPLQAEREDRAREAFSDLLSISAVPRKAGDAMRNLYLNELMALNEEELYAGLR